MSQRAIRPPLIEKFVVRLPIGMRKRVEELALQNLTSMNTEIIHAIEAHLRCQARQLLLIEALEEKLSRTPTGIRQEQPLAQAQVDYLDGLKSGTND